jgi:transcriptional regulator
MYVPAHFAASEDDVRALLAAPGLVDLISPTADGLIATPMPMLLDGSSLLGHVARNNPHWEVARGESLAIVRGPDAYVSPSFYPSTREHGRVVPTWNYVTAHVYGELIVHDDPSWLRTLVTRLTDRHEAGVVGRWSVSDAPEAFIEGQLRAIVGVELRIDRIEAKSKLSQNRSAADQDGVIEGLGADDPVAQAMRAARSVLGR